MPLKPGWAWRDVCERAAASLAVLIVVVLIGVIVHVGRWVWSYWSS